MKPIQAHRLSMLPYAVALPLAVGTGVAAYLRVPEPVVTRSSWCPPPEMRAGAGRALTHVSTLARLREIRARFLDLHAGELTDADEATGPASELDRLMMELIADCDPAPTEDRP